MFFLFIMAGKFAIRWGRWYIDCGNGRIRNFRPSGANWLEALHSFHQLGKKQCTRASRSARPWFCWEPFLDAAAASQRTQRPRRLPPRRPQATAVQVRQCRRLLRRVAGILVRRKDPTPARLKGRTRVPRHRMRVLRPVQPQVADIQVRLNHRMQVRLKDHMRVLLPLQRRAVDIRVRLKDHMRVLRPVQRRAVDIQVRLNHHTQVHLRDHMQVLLRRLRQAAGIRVRLKDRTQVLRPVLQQAADTLARLLAAVAIPARLLAAAVIRARLAAVIQVVIPAQHRPRRATTQRKLERNRTACSVRRSKDCLAGRIRKRHPT